MRKGLLESLAAVLVGAGLAVAQSPAPRTIPDLTAVQVPDSTTPGEGQPKVEMIAPPKGSAPAAAAKPECERDPCIDYNRIWLGAEYLYWWVKSANMPPLLTSGSPASTAPGVLGEPDTVILFGDRLDNEPRYGARFTAGFWIDKDHTLGVEGSYFFLGTRRADRFVGSPDFPVLARPFFDINAGVESSLIISLPDTVGGNAAIRTTSRLDGGEGHAVWNLRSQPNARLDLLLGARHLQLEDALSITNDLRVDPFVPGTVAGVRFQVGDSFETDNQFYGGQVGLRTEMRFCNLIVQGTGKVAIGGMYEAVTIQGSRFLTAFGQRLPGASAEGGLLAAPSNQNLHSRTQFAVMPEATVNVGYQLTNHLRAFVGFNFLYINDVVRPGDQIDLAVNITQFPSTIVQVGGPTGPFVPVFPPASGPPRPAFTFRDTDFWAYGVNFGMEFRY